MRKEYGPLLKDENYIVHISSVAKFIGCFGFCWSMMLERFNFKVVVGLIFTCYIMVAFVSPIVMLQLEGALALKKTVYFVSIVTQSYGNIG